MIPTWCTFNLVYWESSGSTRFEHYLLILRRRYTNGIWYIACVCQLAVARLQWYANAVYLAPPQDEQVMLETCRGPWFSINWMKSASRWFHYTEISAVVFPSKFCEMMRHIDVVTPSWCDALRAVNVRLFLASLSRVHELHGEATKPNIWRLAW
jgi:hypothetical protein